jgi:lambda family phage portal protein
MIGYVAALWNAVTKRKPPAVSKRMYQSARVNRLTVGWATMDTSADSELSLSLRQLRSRSRALVRDASYAKRAKQIVQNNVIGPGMGLQAQVMTSRAVLNERVNTGIERAWLEWCRAENCHTGGVLHFADLEAALVGQWFEAGECFVRRHYRAFGKSAVPLALEMIEAERLPDETPQGNIAAGKTIRMCVEVDAFYRPTAYWIRSLHPGDLRVTVTESQKWDRIPADSIWHLKVTSRWPQTRGEPPMHTIVRKLNDMDAYSEAEIIAARGAASYMAFVETESPNSPIAEEQDGGGKGVTIEPGIVAHLAPGEKINFVTPNRPTAAIDPFMRLMLREVAAGIGVSYESLSRDYAQSNYSSSRLAVLDDRDLWRVLQQWFIRSIREPLHREWLRQAVLAGAIPEISPEEYMQNPMKFEAVKFKPRGWSWIDPASEVESFVKAIRCGLTTTTDVIAQTANGDDIEDMLERRARELELMHSKGLEFDTDPSRDEKGKPAEPEEGPGAAAPVEERPRVISISGGGHAR